MGFVFERFFVYAKIDACENFPYVDAFETARVFFLLLVGSKRLETVLNIDIYCFKTKRKKKSCPSSNSDYRNGIVI